jgi:hypothetical protein
MAQVLSQRSGGESETEQEAEEDTVPPPVIVRPPSAPDAENLTALRESGVPEMTALLDEARGEEKRVAQAQGTFIPTPAPVVVEAVAEQEAAAQEEMGSASGQSESESEEATTAQQDGYESGLRVFRPK